MAKMNKTEAMATASNMARKSSFVQDVTVEWLKELDYNGRRKMAVELIGASLPESYKPEHAEDIKQAFVDAAMKIWAGKEQQARARQNSWRRALEGVSLAAADAKVKTFLESLNIRGARIDAGYMGGTLEVYRGGENRLSCRMYWKFNREDDRLVNPDDNTQCAGTYSFFTEFSTSGTTYTPAEMRVVHKIQEELMDVAAELEAMMKYVKTIWTYGLDQDTRV